MGMGWRNVGRDRWRNTVQPVPRLWFAASVQRQRHGRTWLLVLPTVLGPASQSLSYFPDILVPLLSRRTRRRSSASWTPVQNVPTQSLNAPGRKPCHRFRQLMRHGSLVTDHPALKALPMHDIICQYRSLEGAQPVCQIVSQLSNAPLRLSHTNDSACVFCLSCGIDPYTPNRATASMAIHAARRAGESFNGPIQRRMQPFLMVNAPPANAANTPCRLRGPQIRTQPCPPCQAGSKTPVLVPVYRCPVHQECTIRNTGIHPRIQGCVTCQSRTLQTVADLSKTLTEDPRV